jgi:hypothetical protein
MHSQYVLRIYPRMSSVFTRAILEMVDYKPKVYSQELIDLYEIFI